MGNYNEKLNRIIQGLITGDSKIVAEYCDPIKVIQVAIEGGASDSQIIELKNIYLDPALEGLDELDIGYEISKIPGYYGSFTEVPNANLQKLMNRSRNPWKIIKCAREEGGLSEDQAEQLFQLLFHDDSTYMGISVSEDLSMSKDYPKLMRALASVDGIKPSDIIETIWLDSDLEHPVQVATEIAEDYPEVIRYLEEFNKNNDNKYKYNLDDTKNRIDVKNQIHEILKSREIDGFVNNNQVIDLAKNYHVTSGEKEELLEVIINNPDLYQAEQLIRFAKEVEYADVNRIQEAILSIGSVHAISQFIIEASLQRFFGYVFKKNIPNLLTALDRAVNHLMDENLKVINTESQKIKVIRLMNKSLGKVYDVYNFANLSEEEKVKVEKIIKKLETFIMSLEKMRFPLPGEDTPTV